MILKLFLLMAIVIPAQAADLRVLSWNTYMLPKPIKMSNQELRTKVIAKALLGEDYEFVFMQEAFMGSFRDYVGKALKSKYPYQYYLGNNKIIYPFFGSGVFVMGKYPFKVLDKVYFKECGAADCWASKGSVLIESKLPSGKTVQFATTHLQAKEKLGLVRLNQLGRIKAMLEKHKKPDVPQLLIGDLNIDAKEKEFRPAQDLLQMDAAELAGPINHTNVIDCYKKPDAEKEWIDHMWVARDSGIKDSVIQSVEFTYEYKGKTCQAADHYAIEGLFTFADQ